MLRVRELFLQTSCDEPTPEARRFDWRILHLINRMSASIVVQRGLETLRWLVFFLVLERVGEVAFVITNIAYNCYVVFRIPTEGVSGTRTRW